MVVLVPSYIVYTDASDNACGAQLSQEHDGTEFPIAFFCILSQIYRENGAPQNKKPLGVHSLIFQNLV